MKQRTKKRTTRRGEQTRVKDEDTLEGWPPFTVFLTCNNRGRLYHRTKSQAANILAIKAEALCGVHVYHDANMRRTWEDIEAVDVCTTCKDLAGSF